MRENSPFGIGLKIPCKGTSDEGSAKELLCHPKKHHQTTKMKKPKLSCICSPPPKQGLFFSVDVHSYKPWAPKTYMFRGLYGKQPGF